MELASPRRERAERQKEGPAKPMAEWGKRERVPTIRSEVRKVAIPP